MLPRSDGTWEYRRCRPALSTIKEGEVLPGTDMMERINEGKDKEEDELDKIDDFRVTVPHLSGKARPICLILVCEALWRELRSLTQRRR